MTFENMKVYCKKKKNFCEHNFQSKPVRPSLIVNIICDTAVMTYQRPSRFQSQGALQLILSGKTDTMCDFHGVKEISDMTREIGLKYLILTYLVLVQNYRPIDNLKQM